MQVENPTQDFTEAPAMTDAEFLRGVSIGSLVDAMRVGRERGLVGITFDDGYLNVLEAALPELKRCGFTATVFVIAGRLSAARPWSSSGASGTERLPTCHLQILTSSLRAAPSGRHMTAAQVRPI